MKTKVHLVGLLFDQPWSNGLYCQIANVVFVSFGMHFSEKLMKILLDLTMLHTITLLTLVNYSASMMKALQLQYVRKSVKTKVHLLGL